MSEHLTAHSLRASRIAAWTGGLLAVLIIAVACVLVELGRRHETQRWTERLDSLTVSMAEHAAQNINTGYLVLDGVVERIAKENIDSAQELRRRMGSPEIFQFMRDKRSSSPQIDVLTIGADNGDVINFTRQHPPPPINLGDRDYFQAQMKDPKLGIFISVPVRNRGTGTWVFYLSRRINDREGRMIGFVLVGISTESIASYYDKITAGEGMTLVTFRDDFRVMARWPNDDSLIGTSSTGGGSYQIIEEMGKSSGVIQTESPRFTGSPDKALRLVAARRTPTFPLVVSATATSELYLSDWRKTSLAIGFSAAFSALIVAIAFYYLSRLLARQEQGMAEIVSLKETAERASLAAQQINLALTQNERALRSSEANLEQVFSTCPDGIVTISAGGLVYSANAAFLQFFGLTLEHILGNTEPELHARLLKMGADSGLAEQAGRMAGSPGLFSDRVLTIARPRRVVLKLVVCPPKGLPVNQRVLYFRDLTPEVGLLAAQSDFLSSAAHELRTPMTSVLGFSELLLMNREYDQGTIDEAIQMIHNQARQMVSLVNELLDLARIEARAGKAFDFELQPLRTLVESAVAELMMPGDDRRVRVDIEANLPPMLLDGDKIKRALTNVLANAYKYSAPDSPIALSVFCESAGGVPRVGIRVTDQGVGMSAEDLTHVFEPFWRAEKSRSTRGTGLGLSLVKKILEGHGGEIEIRSAIREGTAVTLWIACRAPRGDATIPEASA